MRNSKIVDQDGFLCPYDFILGVGMEQTVSFSPTDVGPFWMTATEKNERRLDRARTEADPRKPQNKTKRDLAAKLSVPGHVLDPTKFQSEKLQEMASAQDIPLTKIVPNVEAGWVGKQKGLLQVLWERRWIDESRLDDYTIIRKDDAHGAVDLELSLQCLMESCLDFANEIMEVQPMGEKMGVRVISTTKFHAEMAGDGIEYLS
jgi:hypothetical protein